MTKHFLLKTLFLLCTLVAGNSYAWGDTFVKITSASELVADAEYLLVSGTEAYSGVSSNIGQHVAVTFTGDDITDISTAHVLRLGGSSDAWTFYDITDEKYIAYTSTATSKSNNLFQVESNTANGATWTLTVSETTVKMRNNYNTGRWMRYNSDRFCCYYSASTESTIGSAVTLYKKQESTKVAKPIFSPVAGGVEAGTNVTISCATEGATIYYTMGSAPSDPTTGSIEYTGAITINNAITIKAIAVKDGMTNSDIVSASYTIKEVVHGYSIDFENPVDAYVDWTITNIGIHTTGVTAAHSGSAWGSNVNESDNGVGTAIIQTKEKVANPGVFSCYISKESSNTTASSWKIQVSSDGETWEDIAELSSMTQNTWTKFEGDIHAKGYTNVYVRLYYSGSTAKRAVDDIVLTELGTISISPDCTDGEGNYYGTFSIDRAFVVPSDLTVSTIELDGEGKLVTTDFAPGEIVKANYGVLVSSTTAGDHTVALSAETGIDHAENLLKPSGDAGITASDMGTTAPGCKYYRLTMHNGDALGFWWGAADGAAFDIAANKAYLAVPTAGAREGFTFVEDVTTAIRDNNRETITNNHYYDLQGRRVSQPQKGLYIVNGKKVFVK